MGGMYAGIQALVKIAEKLGVKFIYDMPVKKINVGKSKARPEQGRRVESVETADGRRLTADIFVGNADLPYIYQELLPDVKEAKKLVEDKLYTCSTIMFYWGVDKEYKQIAHHNVFLGGDYKASFTQIFNDHTLPEVPSFYVHAPARTDKSAAPEGQDTLYVLVPVGHLDARTKQDWESLVNRARETVLNRLASEMEAEDLRRHIKFEIVYQPQMWKDRFNLVNGSAFGLSHNFTQVGYLRPQNRHKQYKNLYFAGASTHPGTGLPIVLLSAKLTTQRILKEAGTITEQNLLKALAAARA
jgi:phytoene desaturase